MENDVLVSVIVVTYNSSKTVIETLESIKQQTYSYLELIISDDCSRDNTVELCEKWLKDNDKFFIKVQLLRVEKNTGVCANMNRAVSGSSGEWIKGIAADDKLLPNCIKDFVKFAEEHPEACFITSFERDYHDTFEEKNLIKAMKAGTSDLSIFDMDVGKQLENMAFNIFVNAPTIFFKRSLYDKVGGFDERYAFEDYPFYINVLEHEYKIYHMPKETVCYRVHDSTYNSNRKLFNPEIMKSIRSFMKERCFKYYTFKQKMLWRFRWLLEDVINVLGLNRHSKIMDYLYNKIVNMPAKIARY